MRVGSADQEVLQSFGPERAGEQVGWVDVREVERPDAAPLLEARVGVATIGEAGAAYTFGRSPEHKPVFWRDCVRGFQNPTSLSAYRVQIDDATRQSHVQVEQASRWDERDNFSFMGRENPFLGGFRGENGPEDGRGEWVLGASNIVQAIKSRLEPFGEEGARLYETVYYTLAQHVRPEDQLADPAMQERTVREHAVASYIVDLLKDSVAADEDLTHKLNELTLGGLQAFSETFALERDAMAEREAAYWPAVGQSAIAPVRLYLPDSAGRTWPYMDATADSKDKAYGQELTALQQGNLGIVNYELGREMTSLDIRLTAARDIQERFARLALLEIGQ